MTNYPKVNVQIVGYAGKKYLSFCINSIKSQTYSNIDIKYIDCDSIDGSLKYMESNYPEIKAIKKDNLGYTGGHNVGLNISDGKYILILNADIILEPDYITNVVNFLESNNDVGAVTGKLLKFKLSDQGEVKKTNIIDSLGLKVWKNHRVTEIGGGKKDYDVKTQEIFGVSGAAPMFRKEALEDIKLNDQYFDEDLFMYKEDVDISWRLRHAGWKCYLISSSVAYHDRWESGSSSDNKKVLKNRKAKSVFTNFHSYRNHLIVNLKNEFTKNIIKYFPQIVWYELKKFIYLLLFEIKTLKGLVDFIKTLPLTLKKRNDILSKSKLKPSSMKRWYNF